MNKGFLGVTDFKTRVEIWEFKTADQNFHKIAHFFNTVRRAERVNTACNFKSFLTLVNRRLLKHRYNRPESI